MRILHITDLHAGWIRDPRQEEERWKELCRAVIKLQAQPVELVVVTGDLCKTGSPEEYSRAEAFLRELAGCLKLGTERFFFCPGNHDADTIYAGSSFDHYEGFLKSFYAPGQIPVQGALAAGARIYVLDSCEKTSLARFDDAWLDPEKVSEILRLAAGAEEGTIQLLLMHHQPEILPDQTELARLGESGYFACMFGGHLHAGYARQYEWRKMTVINGVAVTPHLPYIPWGFQIVEIGGTGDVRLETYVCTGKDGYHLQLPDQETEVS